MSGTNRKLKRGGERSQNGRRTLGTHVWQNRRDGFEGKWGRVDRPEDEPKWEQRWTGASRARSAGGGSGSPCHSIAHCSEPVGTADRCRTSVESRQQVPGV